MRTAYGWLLVFFFLPAAFGEYRLGLGIADVTGPVAGITLMGYGNMEQQGTGLHLRQWARSYIIEKGNKSFVFVNVDCAMMSDGVRNEVLKRLQELFGDVYNIDNLMISATHTHSGVGGYLMHILFDLPSFGFSMETFEAMVSGIVKSISMAHRKLQRGYLEIAVGQVTNANLNRSPIAYNANPEEERNRYESNVDNTITQLRFFAQNGQPLGVINWFAVHPTSMNYTNTLVSSDNVGYAAILFEQMMNPGKLLGKGPFVASFASSNLGDVSPNINGPLCQKSGLVCGVDNTCDSFFDSCYAMGPGRDMFESTKIIAKRIFTSAWNLWRNKKGTRIEGEIGSVHQYVDMPNVTIEVSNKKVTGCSPAMGYSFASGTIDGPFATHIVPQGTLKSYPWLDTIRNILGAPTPEDIACHAPKPILLATSQMTYPFDWQPQIVSTHLAVLGQIGIACVPGEFTTMAGRRMRAVLKESLEGLSEVIIAGLCNTYSDYITTFEEYQVQRYEGASTLFGPHTLSIYLNQYQNLAQFLFKGNLPRGPEPKGLDPKNQMSFILPVIVDYPRWFKKFGDVIDEPELVTEPGKIVTASFVAGHPRNNLKLDDTYLTIERKSENWQVVATDADWETKFIWKRTYHFVGTSTVIVKWAVGQNSLPGTYRIRHFGSFKSPLSVIDDYEGVSRTFLVLPKRGTCFLNCSCKIRFICCEKLVGN